MARGSSRVTAGLGPSKRTPHSIAEDHTRHVHRRAVPDRLVRHPRARPAFLAGLLVSAGLTSLPWFTGRLMPDLFAGLLGILVYLLVFACDRRPGKPGKETAGRSVPIRSIVDPAVDRPLPEKPRSASGVTAVLIAPPAAAQGAFARAERV